MSFLPLRPLALGAAASALMFAGSAAAQTAGQAQQPPEAKFSTETAAQCLVTFEWMLEFMSPPEGEQITPQIAQNQQINNLAAAMWEYELQVAAQGKAKEEVEQTYVSAAENLVSKFPEADNDAAVQQIVETVMTEATECGSKLQAQYPSGTHPVIEALRAQAQAAQQGQQGQPAPMPTE